VKSEKFLTLLLLLIIPCLALAQKKELSQARTILKSKRGVEQAEQLMTKLLKDSANRQDKRIYAVWYESVLMQYQAVNEKLYMKQRQDTAQFFELTRRLFNVAEALDSLDMRPDRKGRVDPEYRKEHAEQLMKFRPNLFVASTYFVRKSDFKKAYDFMEAYMDCARQPLFTGYHLDSLDERMPEAAYWATYCGYRMNDPVLTLRYRHLALRDTARAEYTLQYMSEARRQLNDDSLYMETLREGFHRYPTNSYFFPRLMDYYTARGDNAEALNVVNRALEVNDSSMLYLYAKSTVLFNMGRYDESIALSDTLIARNDSMPDPYYNAGTAYLNKALKLHPLREKKQLKLTYQKARPYMERYRQLAPDQKQKWGPALYRIYLNLNMGRQFDEIDQLMK
jgi:tetratricopeptide (TPR) repeat protein